MMPSERANSSAAKFWSSLMRLRNFLSPSSSIASSPMNMYSSPSSRQKRNTSLLRSSTSPRVFQVVFLANATAPDRLADLHAMFGMHEGHVIDDEHAGFADLGSSAATTSGLTRR